MFLFMLTAVGFSLFIALQPRDTRVEIEKLSAGWKPCGRDSICEKFVCSGTHLQINTDGTYDFAHYGSFGIDGSGTGNWSLERNIVNFRAASSTGFVGDLRWALVANEEGRTVLIPDYFADWYVDNGYAKQLSFRQPNEIVTANTE